MSTKTAFKRVALVAAAALAIGGISAVSANATVPTPDWAISNAISTGTSSTAETATQVAGQFNSVHLVVNTIAGSTGVGYTISGGATTTGLTSGVLATGGAIDVATPAVGTVTVSSYDITNGAAATSATSTVTISVISAVAGTVYSSSTVLGASGNTAPTSSTDSAFSVIAPAALPAGVVANWSLTEADAGGTTLGTGYAKAISVAASIGTLAVVSGGGTLAASGGYLSGTPSAGTAAFSLSNNGQSGVSTVTVAVNGVTVKTYSVIFSGTAAKIVLTAINPVVAVGTAASELTAGITANTNALEVQEFDASGNAVAVNTSNITVTPAASATATAGLFDVGTGTTHTLGDISGGTATSTSVVGVSVNGVAAGTTTFTATDSANSLTSGSVSVRVSSATPTTVVYTTDSDSYSAGGVGTLTATVSDAAGTVPAGSYAVLSANASSTLAFAVAPTSALASTLVVNDSGVASASFNAPISDGTVTVSGTGASTSITVTPATFTVSSGSTDAANAATDAANEATDAANAATDAANAAADSADAATQAAQDAGDKADAALAAVTALGQQVTDLLSKVASLSALLVRIIKKIKA